jgi:serine/threonine-protein kinase HipA
MKNGRNRKIERRDFISLFEGQKLDKKQQLNIFKRMEKAESAWMKYIDSSFVSDDLKTSLMDIIRERFTRLREG